MKTGTTSLFQYLDSHPEVFMSRPKELHFFSKRAGADLQWYEQHFITSGKATAIGEASASYTAYPESEGVAARVAHVIPDARLIYVVRHPIERMRSHYLHCVGRDVEYMPIDTALVANPIYLRTSQYAEQIEAYLQYFAREQILLVQSEDLLMMREPTLRRIYGFIGVDDTWVASSLDQEFNRTSDKRVPRTAVLPLLRSTQAKKLARQMPDPFAKLLRRVTRRSIAPDQGHIGADLWLRLEDLLRDDIRRFCGLAGEGFDGWGIV